MSLKRSRRPAEADENTPKRSQRAPKPTQRLLESQQQLTPQPTQPSIEIPEELEPPIEALVEERAHRLSPRPILQAFQASQTADEPAWESQFVANKPATALNMPRAFSSVATEASVDEDASTPIDFINYEGLDLKRLPGFNVPLSTSTASTSWIFKHGYRPRKTGTKPERIYFQCKYCHINRKPGGLHQTTLSTTAANNHLKQDSPGHRLTKQSPIVHQKPRELGQTSLGWAEDKGIQFSQEAAQVLGNFDVQGFRQAAVLWLVVNNRPLHEFETQAFRAMIGFANPTAEAALWTSHNSVSRFVMRLYSWLQPQIKRTLSRASSKVHISFDGWTTKGGKRGFFAVCTHYADAEGNIVDLPIALPQLVGAHTGLAIAETVTQVLRYFSVSSSNLGYFVLDNASNNDTAINKLSSVYGFRATDRRLRCACHILNLVGQTIMFGTDADAYKNATENQGEEEYFMKQWRKNGPLGVFLDIVNYINTPKQWGIFEDCQNGEAAALPTDCTTRCREPFKPAVTRSNSYHDCFKRGVELKYAIDSYASFHIQETERADEVAKEYNNKLPTVPSWMRSGGLTAADWAVITEYIEVLEPLKFATDRLQGRGKAGTHGALYEVIPILESLIADLNTRLKPYTAVDFEPAEAPEDHIAINVRAVLKKATTYLNKLLKIHVYYTATALHPHYKHYFERLWHNKPEQLQAARAGFQQIWSSYKPTTVASTVATPKHTISSFDDAIDSILDDEIGTTSAADDYDAWLREPAWTANQYKAGCTVVQYWLQLKPKYPKLSQLASDVVTIPASSADCERVFSSTGDIMEPQRRKMGSQLLAALICIQRWIRAGFKPPNGKAAATYTDKELNEQFGIEKWEEPLSTTETHFLQS